MTKEEQLQQAYRTLHDYIRKLSELAGMDEAYAENLWGRIRKSGGVMQELAYYHDYGKFLGKYSVEGYTLPDILVWQVDHFKAYLDRHEEVNRYKTEKLFLNSLDILLQMEEQPQQYIDKMSSETGTDYEGKY